jgi:putative transposase
VAPNEVSCIRETKTIRLVEEAHLSARLTLAKRGIPRTIFYRWCDRYLQRGEAGLQDQSPKPKHVWNRNSDEVLHKVLKLALKELESSSLELAVTFKDQESYFGSEASTYQILKAHDLITSPAFISQHGSKVIAAHQGCERVQRQNHGVQLAWQTDFTYPKINGWSWFYLSTTLDDDCRYIIAWKLSANMRTEDVTDTLDLALMASGCDQVHVVY